MDGYDQETYGAMRCGAVRFRFDADPDFVAVRYCPDCKRASGGEAVTLLAIPEDDFTLQYLSRRLFTTPPLRAEGWIGISARTRNNIQYCVPTDNQPILDKRLRIA